MMSIYPKIFSFGLLGLLIGGLGGCGSSIPVGIGVGHRAPDFALPDSEGKTTELAGFRGSQPVVLVFYSTSG